ncbi:EDD domain protein, DegV family [Ruminococcus sp. YE71]|uniref:DegV family protein n=1 Tax=unclassified Ruminococcus TaxID=2608920 RepID=UPI00088176FE|nr:MULTISPECIES: DegV family protein [unclassified Ruminococcus]SDA13498.1 EDD domain protein, DegV family [Ruminococcus sp. YE78]SFW19193.1 EDD domain protein, DegV family [Ruminococcus sp. YE71]
MRKLINAVLDEKRSMNERIFLLLGTLGLTAMLAIIVVGILTREDQYDLLTLVVSFVIFVLLMFIGIRTRKYNVISGVISVFMIILLLPLTFFSGGGIYGGSPLWFVFCTLFISMIMEGRFKYFLLITNAIVAAACYIVAYEVPSLMTEHNDKTAFIDSFISMVFVGTMLSFIVGFEIHTLRREKERSEEQSRKIEELNKAQNRFFSSMSHEIRTPINTIIGLNEMILREDISEEVADDAKNIRSASKILLSLINDILDMSKMESGRMEIVPVVYDVGKMLTDIVNMVSVMADAKGLRFIVDVDPTMPSQLLSDEVRIKQIVINLLNNAVKYTRAGSVKFSVHCRRTGTGKALVTYSVEDTGIGIRKENIPHLFDAFRRVDEEKNRSIEGTGLGLSIVKQLVDLLGGEISVNSIYTKGSAFAVTLEQETVDDKELGVFSTGRFRTSGSSVLGGESFEAPRARVLIVDDNRANLMVAEKLLRRTKVQTDTAESGEECLRLTLINHYDAIFMDHMMPVMDGIECMNAVRAQSGGLCRETPMVVLTANAGSEDRLLYQRSGFDAYLLKPIDAAVLEETLLNVLPDELVKIKGVGVTRYETGEFIRSSKRKVPLLITTDSVADLPKKLLDTYDIPVIPYKVYTDTGLFDDNLETDGDVLIRCMEEEKTVVRSDCPSVQDYEEFFAEQLSRAQHIIHITISKRASGGFANACEAALAFYNVNVVDSGHLSSGTGLLVLDAVMQMKQTPFADAEELKNSIELMRGTIQTSFILRDTEYICRSGRLSERMNRLCNAFMVHPVIVMKDSSMNVGRVIFGSRKRSHRKYIRRTLRRSGSISRDTLFITYAGMRTDEIEEIRDMVSEYVSFDNVYLQKASPAICANCGAGTFGLMFARK